jgi:hypothetical protein
MNSQEKVCGNCQFFTRMIKDNYRKEMSDKGLCSGLPPQIRVGVNKEDEFVHPIVHMQVKACSLFQSIHKPEEKKPTDKAYKRVEFQYEALVKEYENYCFVERLGLVSRYFNVLMLAVKNQKFNKNRRGVKL